MPKPINLLARWLKELRKKMRLSSPNLQVMVRLRRPSKMARLPKSRMISSERLSKASSRRIKTRSSRRGFSTWGPVLSTKTVIGRTESRDYLCKSMKSKQSKGMCQGRGFTQSKSPMVSYLNEHITKQLVTRKVSQLCSSF